MPAPMMMMSTVVAIPISEGDLIAALQVEQCSCLGGRRDLKGKGLENAADLLHLIRVGLCQFAFPHVDGILETDPHIGAHDSAHRAEGHLVAASCQDRPLVVLAEKLVRDLPHVHEILWIRTDSAENAEDRLHEKRRLHQLAVEEVRQVVEVPDVIAFELEAGSTPLAQLLKNLLDILEGITKNKVPAVFK